MTALDGAIEVRRAADGLRRACLVHLPDWFALVGDASTVKHLPPPPADFDALLRDIDAAEARALRGHN